MAVPVFLRKQREARKLTQSDVAKVLGISYQSYQRL
ncbi:MAG: helix-turn-helix domain-containing protein, partial [Planctomycetota bacterium]